MGQVRQKFFRGHRVKIAKDLGKQMFHFPKNLEAIILGSYRDLRGGSSREYPVYAVLLHYPKRRIWTFCAWYEEDQLTLIDSNRDKGEEILQKYGHHGEY